MRIKRQGPSFAFFQSATAADVRKASKAVGHYKRRPMSERANKGTPTLGSLLNLSKKIKGIKYMGFIITPPRDDYAVVVDGFMAPMKYAEPLYRKYGRTADEFEKKGNRVRVWWD